MKDLVEIRRRMREAKTLDEMIDWWLRGIELLKSEQDATTTAAVSFLRKKQ